MKKRSVAVLLMATMLMVMLMGVSMASNNFSVPIHKEIGPDWCMMGGEHDMQKDESQSKAATCTEAGYDYYVCNKCWMWSETKEIKPLGHDYENYETIQPSCESEGTKYFRCTRCDDRYEEKLKATGHDYKWVVEKKATCTSKGLEKEVCQKCGDVKSQKETDALGHDWKVGAHLDATCTEDGYDEMICNRCGTEGPRNPIKALGHDWVKGETVPPDCQNQGHTVYTCSRCKKVEWRDYVPTTGKHDLQESIIKAATCTEDGEKQIFCKVCDYNVREKIPATGHNWEKVETVPATCQNQGYTIYKCKNCGATENRDYVPTTGQHNLKESILKQPTCTADGEKQVYCTVCDYNEKVKIPATGHNWKSEVILKQPTCEEPGEEEMICTKCGTEGPRQAIPATGHDWDEGKVTKEAAVYVEGEITYTCKNDPSHTKVEKIPALPDENGNVTPPDPDGNGDGQDGQNGNGDGQNGNNGQDGTDGQNGQNGNDGKNPDGTVGNADGSNGNGSGTDKNGNGGSGNGNGSSGGSKKSSNLWLILLIIFLLLFGLAAVIILAVRKLKSQRD